jgi:hypothetical protein
MTIDERLEAIAMHLEVLSGMHADLEKRHDEFVKQMTAYAADVKDVVRRLGVIAEAHSIQLDDHERRLDDLDGSRS